MLFMATNRRKNGSGFGDEPQAGHKFSYLYDYNNQPRGHDAFREKARVCNPYYKSSSGTTANKPLQSPKLASICTVITANIRKASTRYLISSVVFHPSLVMHPSS